MERAKLVKDAVAQRIQKIHDLQSSVADLQLNNKKIIAQMRHYRGRFQKYKSLLSSLRDQIYAVKHEEGKIDLTIGRRSAASPCRRVVRPLQ